MPPIAAVVATRDRPRLLAERSLASIAAQTRLPDRLLVADDSAPSLRPANRDAVARFRREGVEAVYIENRRTPGASGAWNTALAELHSIEPSAFVAILDDDDSWDPEYLRRCEQEAVARNLDMVAAGIVYHKSGEGGGIPLSIPKKLDAGDFLVGNPHIQGSNLFARLRKLLEAGGFDEALRSTTDRDICIRLADLGSVKFGSLDEYLVHHYAEPGRARLTSFGGDAKRQGLVGFYRKYRGRMSERVEAEFLARCEDRFGIDAVASDPAPPPEAPGFAPRPAARGLDIIAGAITSPDVRKAAALMDELRRKVGERDGVRLKVVLLENGHQDAASRAELRDAVDAAYRRGLDVELRDLERQRADAGLFGVHPDRLSSRKSIALSRTMLQRYLFTAAKPTPGCVVWILDDDVILYGLGYMADGAIAPVEVDYPSAIARLKASGAAIALGETTGEPPLPFLASVRVQLVDLCHNLHRLAALPPDAPYHSRADENRAVRMAKRDYYYDLSRSETDHLETPFWYEPREAAGMTNRQVFAEIASRLREIASGGQVFRPVVKTRWDDPASALSPSVNRGPSALVFDINALRDFPNAVPQAGGADFRRSDMVWSLLNAFAADRNAVQTGLPIRQVREPSDAEPDFDTLIQDIRGHALYSAMRDVLRGKSERRRRDGGARGFRILEFDDAEIDRAVRLYREYERERRVAFEIGFIRAIGVLSALRKFCERAAAGHSPAWWLDESAPAAALGDFVRRMRKIYNYARLDEYLKAASEADPETAVAAYFSDLPSIVARYRENTPLPARELRLAAETFVKAEFQTGNLAPLGIGEEGVVLTDGELVYKYFHYWKSRDKARKIAFLRTLAGKFGDCETLPNIIEIRERGDAVAAVYPYEPGARYDGGRLDAMLKLLRECRDAGIVCRNIHPDNLLATRGGGLRLIDFGSDIEPYTEKGFERMLRRAFLTFRFHFRSDLKRLMTDSSRDVDMPELTGIEHFRAALDPASPSAALSDALADMATANGARTAFDYGCGRGKLAANLAARGLRVSAFDPDESLAERWRSLGAVVDFVSQDETRRIIADGGAYDAVICSRVLCDIADSDELRRALSDIRALAADGGTVLAAVCNPFYFSEERTEGHERERLDGKPYDSAFAYRERDPSGGEWREEVHRPLGIYRKAFAEAGLNTREIIELPTSDTANLRPASDYLIFRLEPAAKPAARVSLLIKTCYMEWKIAERLIRHQVERLEMSTPFVEKVVVVDTFEGPFLRQYEAPNPQAHRAAMRRLLEDGVVDRVVYAPTDPQIVRDTYIRWFGAESQETHSAGGQQLFATLYGFDACVGDYVLQMDSDILFHASDENHDPVSDMASVLQSDPRALFVPPSICRERPTPHSFQDGEDGSDWRVEVRICMFDRRRLRSVLPIRNPVGGDGAFQMSWHRAFDRFIRESEYRAYRGGDPRTAFIHVPNRWKADADALFEIVAAVERGHIPRAQIGSVNLAGDIDDWRGPKRREPFVFVICGRNPAPGEFKSCIESLFRQQRRDWGAIIVDDASANGFGDYAKTLAAPFADKITLIRNETRRGGLHNTWNAVTRFCDNPESVIITLDADDSLIGDRVLNRVAAEYADGADVTVGSMLRLDKEARYPADFANPRRRGANLWQHLRTFRKYLFDAIAVEDLKLDGEWIDVANDWAFMVPIVEMARSPRFIPDALYLYEPAFPKTASERKARDAIIARVLAKPPYPQLAAAPPAAVSRREST